MSTTDAPIEPTPVVRPASDPGEGPAVYEGLGWITDPLGARQLVASSLSTPQRYVVEYGVEGQCVAHVVFAPTEVIDLETGGHARARLGVFPTLEAAIYAAERHDFNFVRAAAEQRGEDAIFQGSDRIRALVDAIAQGDEDPGDFVPGDHVCPNGRSFSRAASFFPAKKVALKQGSDGSWALQLSIEQGQAPIWLMEAEMGTLLVMGAVAVGHEEDPEGKAWKKRAQDALKRMITMEDEPLFQEWIGSRYDRWGLVATAAGIDSTAVAEAMRETLKRLLGIPSRTDLRTNREAVERLERLDREYYRDLKAGFGASYQDGGMDV